jgi:hypothetical protein
MWASCFSGHEEPPSNTEIYSTNEEDFVMIFRNYKLANKQNMFIKIPKRMSTVTKGKKQ